MKLLFVSHDSSLTGAPMVLNHLIHELAKTGKHDIHILSLAHGPLDDLFRKNGKMVERIYPNWLVRYLRNVFSIFFPPRPELDQFRLDSHYDLIYCNSAVTSRLIPDLNNRYHCPIILHVHELYISIYQFSGADIFKAAIPHVSHFIAVSRAVSSVLTRSFEVPESKISLVYEFIPPEKKTESISSLPNPLATWIEKGHSIIGGSGTTDWRKGPDLFVYTAAELVRMDPTLRFCWVGGFMDSVDFEKMKYEIDRMNLTDKVYITGMTDSPVHLFQTFSVFFLSSREDPFPLVALETGQMGIPVVCFEQSGGIPELLDGLEGLAVPYASIQEAAKRIYDLVSNPGKQRQLGKELASRIQRNHRPEGAVDLISNLVSRLAQ